MKQFSKGKSNGVVLFVTATKFNGVYGEKYGNNLFCNF